MNRKIHDAFVVIGLSARVRNDEPSQIGALWERFFRSGLLERGLNTNSADIYCVYHAYEGNHSDPFEVTIGYCVPTSAVCPAGFSRVEVPQQTVAVFEAIGIQPKALISQWQAIWESPLERAFVADFDVYDADRRDRVTVNVGLKAM